MSIDAAAEYQYGTVRSLLHAPKASCVCGGRIFQREGASGIEWAHRDAFDDRDWTRCADGGQARPALHVVGSP